MSVLYFDRKFMCVYDSRAGKNEVSKCGMKGNVKKGMILAGQISRIFKILYYELTSPCDL